MVCHRLPVVMVCSTVMVIAVGGSSCWACRNDTSIRAAENEFRSRYDVNTSNDAPAAFDREHASAINPWGVGGVAVGSGAVAGACIGIARRHKTGSL